MDFLRARLIRFLALLSLGLGMISCSLFQQMAGFVPTEPTVKIQEIHIDKLNFQTIEMQVLVRIVNPNQFTLELGNIRYRAAVGEQVLAVGERLAHLTVEKYGIQDVSLPLTIDVSKSLLILKDIFIGGHSKQLDLTGNITILSSIHDWSIDFSQSKTIGKELF